MTKVPSAASNSPAAPRANGVSDFPRLAIRDCFGFRNSDFGFFGFVRVHLFLTVISWLAPLGAPAQTGWLEQFDDRLYVQSADGFWRVDLSGLLDFEGYYVDQHPPGLLFSDDRFFFNPRATFFVDTRLGRHFYSLVQARIDRGFDPGVDLGGDARLDEYLLRYTPFEDGRLNIQIGKFATVAGNWVARHDSWSNPLINAPLPYENVVIIADHSVPGSPAALLGRRAVPDQKRAWLPLIWGPSYATGASVFGRLDRFDYAVEIKNVSLSSRPYAWDPLRVGWGYPTFTGRAGYRPSAAWNLGASFSYGTYLVPSARSFLREGRTLNDYNQITLGYDLGYAWRHFQFWAELFLSRFQVPNTGNADTLAYYLEAKYKLDSSWFIAARWNQQLFGRIDNGAGDREPWDRDVWRIDAGLGYRFDRHIQAKLQYSYSHQQGPFQQGEQLAAAQLTVKF